MARCKYCSKEIVWLPEGRKKVPVENDGTKHECEEYIKSKNSLKAVDLGMIDPEILAQYQANINKKKKK